MMSLDQTIQGVYKRKELLVYSAKVACFLSFIWAALFYLLLFTFNFSQLNLLANGMQLIYGLGVGTLVLVYARYSRERYLAVGVALAVLSWTLGQLYWFSCIFIDDTVLPYPSIADFGFIGTYFFLIGVIRTITMRISPYTIQITVRNLWPFSILMAPLLLGFIGANTLGINMANLALALAIAHTLWNVQSIFPMKQYGLFLFGLCILCLCDIIFMVFACLVPETYTFSTDALFPIALSLIAYGFIKAEEMSDE